MKEQTRKDMQQKMADYQMAAPEVSWAEIERAVGAQAHRAVVIPLWRKRVAAVAAVLIVGGTGFWMLHRQGQMDHQQTGQHKVASKVVKTNEPSLIAEADQPTTTSTTKPTTYSLAAPSPSATEAGTLPHEDTPEESDTQPTKQATQQQHVPASSTKSSMKAPSQTTVHHPAIDSRLTAKVYIGNSMNDYASSSTFTPMLMSAPLFGKSDEAIDYKGDTPLHEDAAEFKTSVRHHQPLRFGVSLRYDLGNRWSVESGLSYTRHKSDITNQAGNELTTTEQRLSYIGIPLNVGYRIWSNQRLNFYVSTGGMVEKMVKGSRSTQGTTTESVSIRPLQFSLNGMAGAEFRIDKAFSLYMEPGVSYHFDNGSNVPTIYQDEPLNLNLNIGLRFSFK